MRRLLKVQFIRFLLVGGLNTLFSYAVYAMLLSAGLSYVWANLCSLVLGIAVSFATQGRFVFGNRGGGRIGRFVACWGLIWVVNVLLIAGLIRLGLNAYWAGALALIPVALMSYAVQKFLVFSVQVPASAAEKKME